MLSVVAPLTDNRPWLKFFRGKKRSSLFCRSVIDKEKKFDNVDAKENERYKLRVRHIVEKEKLVLAVEQVSNLIKFFYENCNFLR
jgi:hypothetical protein